MNMSVLPYHIMQIKLKKLVGVYPKPGFPTSTKTFKF